MNPSTPPPDVTPSPGSAAGPRAPSPTSSDPDPTARLRRSVYSLFIVVAAGAMLGRILAVNAVDRVELERYRIERAVDTKREALAKLGLKGPELQEALDYEETRIRNALQLQRPFLSGNDRSRWCTVRALVEDKFRVEGAPYAIDKLIDEPLWDTIDMVRAPNGHYYSSKPPLLPTLMAGPYWLIHRLTGATLGTHPYEIGRAFLIVLNVIPLVVYFFLLAGLAERLATSDWARLAMMATASLGTFLNTFATVLNNHLFGAVCAGAVLYFLVRIWFEGQRRPWVFFLTGLLAAFMVANELPSLAFAAPVALFLLYKAPRPTLFWFAPGALLVAAGFFGTNWIAFQTLKPAYAHRTGPGNWYDYTYQRNGKTYESYWKNPKSVDQGEPSVAVYVNQCLVGHHGIFSLTPMWLLSLVGGLIWLCGPTRKPPDACPVPASPPVRLLALALLAVSLVCLTFYLFLQPLENRNYGGMCSGLRWVFWLAPLWLVLMLPALDRMAQRACLRLVALILLAASVLSAVYPIWNPWTHPWLYNFMYYLDWI